MTGSALATLTATIVTFRDRMRMLSPPWLQRGLGEKILYSIGAQCDAFGDALVAGVKQRFPGYYSFESLSVLGRERRIYRGRAESDESYAGRLSGFLASHQLRGGPYALLDQLHTYWAPENFPIDLVYVAGARRFHMDMAGNVSRDLVTFAPDPDRAKWARWYLFYYTNRWADVPPTAAELAELRQVPAQWNAAHPFGQIVLFPDGAELWDWPPGRVWDEPGVWDQGAGGGVVRLVDV